MTDPIVVNPGRVCYQELKHWKYRTTQDRLENIGIVPPKDLEIKNKSGEVVMRWTMDGMLYQRHGYCTDGASGPTIDTPDTMRPAHNHDGGYQFGRAGMIGPEYRDKFDRLLERCLIEDGNILAKRLEDLAKTQGWFDALQSRAKAQWIHATIGARAHAWYMAVHQFAGDAFKPGWDPINEEKIAP